MMTSFLALMRLMKKWNKFWICQMNTKLKMFGKDITSWKEKPASLKISCSCCFNLYNSGAGYSTGPFLCVNLDSLFKYQ